MSKKRESQNLPKRPDVFSYYDFRKFLKDWFDFLRDTEPGFSLRTLAENARVATSFLSMIVSGTRGISSKTLAALLPHLGLSHSEQVYLKNLVKLGTVETREGKILAVDRMSRFSSYRKLHPNEANLFQYVSRWYHVAIREMTALPDFKLDPEWIQGRLKVKLPLATIRSAVKFLVDRGFLEVDPAGQVVSSGKALSCDDDIYWAALTESHKQMFAIATESMMNTPHTERNLEGLTFSASAAQFESIRKILNHALTEIETLVNSKSEISDTVYQVELALFPLTKRSGS